MILIKFPFVIIVAFENNPVENTIKVKSYSSEYRIFFQIPRVFEIETLENNILLIDNTNHYKILHENKQSFLYK